MIDGISSKEAKSQFCKIKNQTYKIELKIVDFQKRED